MGGGRNLENGVGRPSRWLDGAGCGQEQAILHAWPGSVAPDSSGTHLHFADRSLDSVVGPGDFGFGLEGDVGVPT
jgi:hypothetical protein